MAQPAVDPTKPGLSKKHWPPNDPPMFWVTLAAFLGVCAYTGVAVVQVYKSQASNEIARDGIYIANRPYFMIDSVTPVNEVDQTGKFVRYRMGPNWINFGNSPADKVTVYICDARITDGPNPPNLACSLSDKAGSNGPIGPKQAWHILGVPVSGDDYDATLSGKKSIYIFAIAHLG